MFKARAKNIGLTKLIRGIRRLRIIMRFAKLIGDQFDPHLFDLGAFTLFHVKGRRLKSEGYHLTDNREYLEYQIISRITDNAFVP